jgi:hypothetical protein
MDTVGKSEGTAPSNNKEDFRRGNLTQKLASACKSLESPRGAP